jgi:hypothetical protein
MAQYVINTGAFPNDGTGDPLRTAFELVNLNFDQIFSAGPVLSNIEIINNTIYTTNTNGNLILNPNGIGNVIANAHVIPDQTRIRNLGAPELLWDTVYAEYFVGDGNGISNISVTKIVNGTTSLEALPSGNILVTIASVPNVVVFTANGMVTTQVSATGNVISSGVVTNTISGNSVTITATGINQSISLVPNGNGVVNVNYHNIINLAEPVNPQDAATKYYVDITAQGLKVKASVALATTTSLPAYVYDNGVDGVNATITGNVAGALSIDSTATTIGSRVLIKNETSSNNPYNGIYVVTDPGSIGNVFVLTRSTDFDNSSPNGTIPGAYTYVTSGVTNTKSGWVCTTVNPVTIGSTAIIWSQFSSAGTYSAGEGLDLVGSQFNVLVDNDTTEINGSNQVAVKPGANLVTPNIGAATGTSLSVTGAVSAGSINTFGNISTTGNIAGGNLTTTGIVNATGAGTFGNISTAGNISAVGRITSTANITGLNLNATGIVSAAGNVQSPNIIATSNIVGGNINTSGVVSAIGNVIGGNLQTVGDVSAGNANISGNVVASNLLTSGIVSATGNVTSGNVRTAGQVSATGNVTSGNVRTAGQVSATGNISSGNYLIGNGAFITGIISSGSQISNGASNVSAEFNGNVTITIASNANIGVFANTGLYVSGIISASGNVSGGNINTNGNISGSNVIGNIGTFNTVTANVLDSNTITSTGNISGNNLVGNTVSGNTVSSAGVVSAVGNVIGGNLQTTGSIAANGNLLVGNVRTPGSVSAVGEIISNSNISGANVYTAGEVSATGNVTGNYIIGNGTFITGLGSLGVALVNGNTNITTSLNGNANVSIAGTSNVIVWADTGEYISGELSVSGNVTGGNVATTGNVSAGNINTDVIVGAEIAVNSTGNITLSTTGNISVGNTYITNLSNPVNLQDAATKYYVDTVATGLDPKASVVYATGVALGVPYTYNNGISGVGATITANLPGNLTIDGNVVQSGQRVLIKNEAGVFVTNTQPSAAFNGIYDVTIAGDDFTAWELTRSADFDINTEMASSFTFVEDGSINADTGWVCITNNPITVGFTPITFTQFSGAGTYTAGNGLSLNGSQFNVQVDNNTTEINLLNQVAVKAGANLTTPNIGAATGTSLSVTGNVTAATFVGNLVGNITGNIDAGGANTQVQFNDDNIIAGSAGFTFDKTSNAMVVVGNITGGNLLTNGIVSSNTGVYGDIYTTSIDSGDSSAIIVTPDLVLLASINVNQDLEVGVQLAVGNIVIPAVGNITVANVNINNLADPVQLQDAATKGYVDTEIANVLPVITNQTISPNGLTAIYTLNQSTTAVGILVTINGITQTPVTNYTVTGNQIIFGETPDSTDIIQIRFLSGTTSSPTIQLPTYTVSEANNLVNVDDGQMIYVSNGDSGQPCIAVYSASGWRRISFGANIGT